MSPRLRSTLAALVALIVLLSGSWSEAQLAPIPQDQGAAGLGLALRRLPVSFNVLYVTAHPDDENNGDPSPDRDAVEVSRETRLCLRRRGRCGPRRR